MKKLILIVWSLVFLLPAANAEIRQVIENFSKDDYEAGAQNWQVKQQKNGIMYFANMNALLSFDGIKWQRHEVPGCGNSLRALHIADNGDVYVGGHNIFGVFKAGNNGLGEFENLSVKLPDGEKNFNEIWFINSLGNKIIFQSYEKLFIYENDRLSVLSSNGRQMLYSTVVHNTLFIATKFDGVFTLNGSQLSPLPNGIDFENKTVCSIVEWNGKLLFVTQDDGLYLYDSWEEAKPFATPSNEEIKTYQAFCAQIKGDKLAVGTVQNGVYVINLISGEYKNINTKNGLQNNTVLSLSFDLNQDLWLGLNRGIDYINLNSPFKLLFDQNNNFGSGYSSLLINHELYLGTNQGLFVTSYNRGDISEIQSIDGTQGQVYNILQVDNKIYCCHHNGLYEIIGNTARRIVNVEGIWTIQRLQKNPNYLIAGFYNGLLLMEKQGTTWTFSHIVEGFNQSSRLFEQDENGDIWVSHGLLGVFRITLSDDLESAANVKFYGKEEGFAYNEHISVFKIDSQIIFAAEDGIYRYDKQSDKMVLDDAMNKSLMGPGQYFYFKQSGNRLWFLKNNSICYAEKQNGNEYSSNPGKAFSIPEELIYEYFNISVLDNNHILVSNEEGFTIVDFNALDQVRIHDVYIRNIYDVKTGNSFAQQYKKGNNATENEKIEIDFKNNSIGFEYCSASYSDQKNKQTLYSTRLVGYENDWSEPTTETNRVFSDLSNGNYTFQVKTYNRNYESAISEIEFTILPPWYRTIVAYICYIIILIIIVLLINRYIKHKEKILEKENQKLMEEQKKTYEREKNEREKQLIELRNSHLEAELKNKSNELASSTMNLIRKNEILIDIKEELQKIQNAIPAGKEKENLCAKIDKVVANINENIEHDDDWMKFEKEFDNIHQNFIKRLSETYKGLTVNDKKLCAYLKMNLVSKDIAPLMNISVRGVEIGRYRLRKKLNLDRDTNLTDFLQNF